jgi:hypothetical protein
MSLTRPTNAGAETTFAKRRPDAACGQYRRPSPAGRLSVFSPRQAAAARLAPAPAPPLGYVETAGLAASGA